MQLGDFCDWDSVTTFDSRRERDIANIEHEVRESNCLLDEIDKAVGKKCIKFMVGGNHEARYERFKVSHGFQISIKRLKDFSNWYAEYNLTSRGWKWCEYGEVHEIGKILFTHGWFTGGSHARRHLQLFHKNIIYGHCFSSDTEIMTRSGWKLFSDTSIGEEVATINHITLNSEWNKINQKFEYGNYDKLIEFKKRSHNFCVTEDHSIIRKYDKRGKWEKVKAKSLFDKNFIIPTASKNNNPEYPITDDELRIMAWIITEGNIEKIGNCRVVRIAQSDKPKVSHNRIIDICNRLGLKNSCKKRYSAGETNHGQHRNFDAYRIYINRCDLLDKILDLIPDKKLQMWMLDLSSRQFKILFKELMLGDGALLKDGNYQYVSKYKIEADILQALCTMNNIRASVLKRINRIKKTTIYSIAINLKNYTYVKKGDARYIKNDKPVYCVSVDNGTLLVRRGGKAMYCGNTHTFQVEIGNGLDNKPIISASIGTLSKFDLSYLVGKPPVNWVNMFAYIDVRESGVFTPHFVPIINGTFTTMGREFGPIAK